MVEEAVDTNDVKICCTEHDGSNDGISRATTIVRSGFHALLVELWIRTQKKFELPRKALAKLRALYVRAYKQSKINVVRINGCLIAWLGTLQLINKEKGINDNLK